MFNDLFCQIERNVNKRGRNSRNDEREKTHHLSLVRTPFSRFSSKTIDLFSRSTVMVQSESFKHFVVASIVVELLDSGEIEGNEESSLFWED